MKQRIQLIVIMLFITMATTAQDTAISFTHTRVGEWNENDESWEFTQWVDKGSVLTINIDEGEAEYLRGGETVKMLLSKDSEYGPDEEWLQFEGYYGDCPITIRVFKATNEYGRRAHLFYWFKSGWVLAQAAYVN